LRDDAERSAEIERTTDAVADDGVELGGELDTEELAEIEAAIAAARTRRDAAQVRVDAAQQALKAALSAELTATQKMLAELDRRHARALDQLDQETNRERVRIIDEARDLAARMMAADPERDGDPLSSADEGGRR
jgi:type II secretory pathway predicted ATPase ExeA